MQGNMPIISNPDNPIYKDSEKTLNSHLFALTTEQYMKLCIWAITVLKYRTLHTLYESLSRNIKFLFVSVKTPSIHI